MKKIFIVLFAIIILGGVGYFGYNWYIGNKSSYITIDINPSVQLVLNGKEEVVEVVALNEDADIILSGLDLVGLSVEDATEDIINSATETGYIDEYGDDNEIVVTAYCDDEELRLKIQDKVESSTADTLDKKNIYYVLSTVTMTDDLKASADEYDISNGKMLLVERAYTLDSSLDKDKLADMSIKEIQDTIHDSVNARYEEQNMTQEQYQKQAKEQKEEKKQNTEAKVNQIINEVKTENQSQIENAGEDQQLKVVEQLLIEKKEQIKSNAEQNGNSNTSNNTNGNK